MDAKSIRQLLKKHLLGRAGNADDQVIDNWYHSFENENPVELSDQERQFTKQEIWDKIEPALVPAKVRMLPQWLKTAAWAAAVATVVFTMVLFLNRQSHENKPAFTTITTKNGERSTITIADGSKLTLNAGTTIHVYNDFSKERKVDLVDGEVFFDVKRNPQKPFRIQSSGLTVSVLGTSFNVSAYTGLNTLSVGVVTGRVGVSKNDDTLGILQKTQELIYNKESQQYVIVPINESLLAWREGTLVLNDLSFNEMSFLMKKNFGIDVITKDTKVLQTKYAGDLPTSLTAQEAVEVLAAIHHLKIKKVNNQFILYQ